MKKKKWNEWTVFGEDILFSVSIWHLDYTAICSVHLLHYETGRFFEKQVTLPARRLKMPQNPNGNLMFSHQQMKFKLTFQHFETKINMTIPSFDNEMLHAELFLFHPPNDETLHVVIPKNRSTFQYTAKHHTIPTTGFVQLGEKMYRFHPDYCFTVLNYNRGIWPKRTFWNLAFASQRIGQERIGINFANQWTKGSGMTENALFIDGRMFKIHEDVIFTYDLKRKGSSWAIQSKFSNNVDLTFTPFFQRSSTVNRRLFRKETEQLIGYFNGTITLPNNRQVHIRQMLGSTEQMRAKW